MFLTSSQLFFAGESDHSDPMIVLLMVASIHIVANYM